MYLLYIIYVYIYITKGLPYTLSIVNFSNCLICTSMASINKHMSTKYSCHR